MPATAISIHAPAWGATRKASFFCAKKLKISIHAPAWGATLRLYRWSQRNFKFQSTLPRGERRIAFLISITSNNISIHAPAWGATGPFSAASCSAVFQSTLPRGERHLSYAKYADIRYFNPRSRVGSDLAAHVPTAAELPSISIHAPAWGATFTLPLHLRPAAISIHAPAWGATARFFDDEQCKVFQSTLPRGERQQKCISFTHF